MRMALILRKKSVGLYSSVDAYGYRGPLSHITCLDINDAGQACCNGKVGVCGHALSPDFLCDVNPCLLQLLPSNLVDRRHEGEGVDPAWKPKMLSSSLKLRLNGISGCQCDFFCTDVSWAEEVNSLRSLSCLVQNPEKQ